jgi:hypothetical protein
VTTINSDDLSAAFSWISAIDNSSGQICRLDPNGNPVEILFEFGCATCSEVASKNAEEYGNALVTVFDAARALFLELRAARAVVAAMRQIDKHVVGAYETDSGSVEPCDECGEMREIAAQVLAEYDKATKQTVAERARLFNKLLNEGKEGAE